MSIVETICLGVLSGILTAVIIYLIASFINKIIIPWGQSVLYSGINISGTWYCLPREMNQEIKVELRQKAKKLTGVATFIVKKTSSNLNPRYTTEHSFEKVRTFTITGEINDRFLTLNLKNVDSKRLGVNAFVFEVCGDGRKMQGALSYYAPSLDEIHCIQLFSYRDRVQAEHAHEKPVNPHYMMDLYEEELDEIEEELDEIEDTKNLEKEPA